MKRLTIFVDEMESDKILKTDKTVNFSSIVNDMLVSLKVKLD